MVNFKFSIFKLNFDFEYPITERSNLKLSPYYLKIVFQNVNYNKMSNVAGNLAYLAHGQRGKYE